MITPEEIAAEVAAYAPKIAHYRATKYLGFDESGVTDEAVTLAIKIGEYGALIKPSGVCPWSADVSYVSPVDLSRHRVKCVGRVCWDDAERATASIRRYYESRYREVAVSNVRRDQPAYA